MTCIPRESAVRVLHICLTLNPGGAERLVVELATRMPARFETAVCCLDEPGSGAPDLRRQGIPIFCLERRPGFRPTLGWRLARLADKNRVHVIHCHQYSPYVYGALARLLRPRLRLVFTEHGRLDDAPPSPRRRIANHVLARVPGRLFVVSAALRGELEREGFPPGRLEVLPNGIDPGPPPDERTRAAARGLLGLSADEVVVGTVARLAPVKDLATLLEAFQHFGPEPRHHLVIVGDGAERRRLVEQSVRLGLGPNVIFLGHRDDIRALLPAFDVYVNCSTYEGISLAILEAMAAARPVVATRVGGTAEIVADGETGLLVPPRRPDALAAALATLLGDFARLAELGRRGRQRVETRFSFDRMRDAYAQAYIEGEVL